MNLSSVWFLRRGRTHIGDVRTIPAPGCLVSVEPLNYSRGDNRTRKLLLAGMHAGDTAETYTLQPRLASALSCRRVLVSRTRTHALTRFSFLTRSALQPSLPPSKERAPGRAPASQIWLAESGSSSPPSARAHSLKVRAEGVIF